MPLSMTDSISRNSSSSYFKRIKHIGLLLFVSEFILAYYLYLERISFGDVAFQTFELARTSEFPTQVYRFGSMLTHVYPWLAIKLNLSLKAVALSYSLGVVLYNFLIFTYLAYVKKSARWTWLFILSSSMLITHMFFWIQSEYSQAIPFFIFLLAYVEEVDISKRHWWRLILTLGFTITVIFFHPLIIVLFTVILPILLFNTSLVSSQKKIYLMTWVFACIVYLIKRFYFDNYYDHQAQDRIQQFVTLFPNYFSTMSTNLFFRNSYTIYLGGWISMAFLLWIWFRQKAWMYMVIGSVLVMGYFFFINVTHPVADLFYLENMYLGLPLIIGLLYLLWVKDFDFWSNYQGKLSIGLSVFLVVMCFIRLSYIGGEYQDRLAWLRHQIDMYQNQKVILSDRNVPKELLKLTWASSCEFWLVSTIDHNRTASILITDNPTNYSKSNQDTRVFYGMHSVSYDSLPKQYFLLQDTTTSYQWVNE